MNFTAGGLYVPLVSDVATMVTGAGITVCADVCGLPSLVPGKSSTLGVRWYHNNIIGLDKQKNFSVKLLIFSYLSDLTYVLGAQKNRLFETFF